MVKAFSALFAAAAVAVVLTFVPGLVPGLSGDVVASVSMLSVKGDRYDAAECERQGWPYYAQDCLKDLRRNAGHAVAARLVTTDRLFAAPVAPLPEWAAYLPAMHPAALELPIAR